jgi:multisubunit Na+/H+ antiporter MnhB subunit
MTYSPLLATLVYVLVGLVAHLVAIRAMWSAQHSSSIAKDFRSHWQLGALLLKPHKALVSIVHKHVPRRFAQWRSRSQCLCLLLSGLLGVMRVVLVVGFRRQTSL